MGEKEKIEKKEEKEEKKSVNDSLSIFQVSPYSVLSLNTKCPPHLPSYLPSKQSFQYFITQGCSGQVVE